MKTPRTKIPRLAYANVAATLALVLSMAGGAYAVGIGKNDVKSKNIAPKAVKTSDLADGAATGQKLAPNAVTTDKVADGNLLASDLEPGQISAAGFSGGVSPAVYEQNMDIETATITTSRPGRLFVFGSVRATLACTSGSCSDTYGLFVDQAAVPGSGTLLGADAVVPDEFAHISLFGVTTNPVPAGTHTIQLNFHQSNGANNSGQFNDARVGAVLLGP
jgi:hypothetical protein